MSNNNESENDGSHSDSPLISILYVDDEQNLLTLGKNYLERSGAFRVDILNSALEALSLPHLRSYDAIISDYQMPDMDGIEFLKNIRSSHRTIPFILFTGRGREEVVIEAINNGADFYLQKGGSPKALFAELEHKIRQAVARRQVERSLIESEKRLSDIINFLPDATFAINKEGIIISWNRAIEEMTGLSSEQMLGRGNYEYALPFYGERRPILIDLIFESNSVIEQRYSHILREKDILIAETSLPRPQEKSVTLLGKASPLYNSSGEIVGAIETIRDITERKKAEQALQQSEKRLREAQEMAHLGFWFWDVKTGAVEWSDEVFRIFCQDPKTFVPQIDSIIALSPWPEENLRDRELIRIATESHTKGGYDQRFLRPDNSIGYYHSTFEGRYDEDDILVSIVGTVLDITDRKRAEEALQENERKFRQLITLAPLPFALVNDDGFIEYTNDRFTQVFGYTREDISSLHEWWQFAYPDERYRQWVIDRWTESVKTASETGSDIEPIEYNVTCKNGMVRNVIISGIMIERSFLAMFIDITERRQAEKALHESEDRYRNIVQNIQDVFFSIDKENRIVMASISAPQLFGYDSVDEMLGMPVTSIWKRPEDRLRYLEALKNQEGVVQGWEAEFVKRDSTAFWVSMSSRMNINEDGNYMGIDGILHDITERKKAEDALLLANKKLNLLSGITRHDINNQLHMLLGFLEISKDTLTEPSITADFIQKEEKVAGTIARQILFTKDYEDMGVRAPSWQNLAAIIDEVITHLPLRDILITVEDRNLEIFADPLLEKVFLNLIDNALRYGGGNMKEIQITARDDNNNRVIIFQDNGVGIHPDDKKNLFMKGFGKHTGLGLFLSREILAITGVTITETGEPGSGARFEMNVPSGMHRNASPSDLS